MFCVAVLAGYGVAFLLSRIRVPGNRILLVAVLCAVVLLEFTIVPPFRSLDTKATTDYYRWLEERPKGSVAAIYPMFQLNDFSNYEYLFQQRLHGKRLINGAGEDGEAQRYRESILDVAHPATPGLLKKLGADYVMVIPDNYLDFAAPHPNYVFPIKVKGLELPEGLRKVEEFPGCIVYRVTATPADFVPLFGTGSCQPFIDPEGRFWHPGKRKTEVEITSDLERDASCDISFGAMSPRKLQSLEVVLNGEKLLSAEIRPWPGEVLIENATLNPGSNTLEFETDAEPVNLTEVPRYQDIPASMLIGDILVTPR
jgi:hypothetical protein